MDGLPSLGPAGPGGVREPSAPSLKMFESAENLAQGSHSMENTAPWETGFLPFI